MSVANDLLARCFQVVERNLAEQGDRAEPELIQLQHDLVEYDLSRPDLEHFTVQGKFNEVHCR